MDVWSLVDTHALTLGESSQGPGMGEELMTRASSHRAAVLHSGLLNSVQLCAPVVSFTMGPRAKVVDITQN